MKYQIITIVFACLFCGTSSIYSQKKSSEQTLLKDTIQIEDLQKDKRNKKSWEIGVGGSLMQLNRVYFTDFAKNPEGGYDFNMKMRHALWGGDLYVARQLSKYFYLDLNAGMGATKVYNIDSKKETKFYYTGGLGLQWRLSPYFKSKYIEPYFRLGAQYMYRDFTVNYSDAQNIDADAMKWIMTNVHNKDGEDVRNLFAIVGGFGVNMWLNDRVGIGLLANYMHMPRFVSRQKHVADAVQGSVRLLFRFGESKKDAPQPKYIETIIEKPVDRIVEVDRVVEREKHVFALLQNVFFHFDTDTFTDTSKENLDQVAELLKTFEDRHFLIIGYTDNRGSEAYNITLSRKRAAAVVKALEERGVPSSMLKSRGVGKKIAAIPANQSNSLREGDRKVSIEEILIDEYWNFLPKRDY